MTIEIIGLGSSDIGHMTLGTYSKLLDSDYLYLRTQDHTAVKLLDDQSIPYETFDNFYLENETFTNTYEQIANYLLEKARTQNVLYVVPGSPLFYETTTELLLNNTEGIPVEVYGGQSFIDVCIEAVNIPINEGLQIIDGSTLKEKDLNHHQHTLITQVYDQFSVSDVKLTLLEKYQADVSVTLIIEAGTETERLISKPLEEIDHNVESSNLMTLYVPKVRSKDMDNRSIYYMRNIFSTLVGENGCPWDKEQTHETLERYLLEESYEVIEAIELEDDELLIEELGDLLLQVGLHAALAERDGYFNFHDILERLNQKLVHRHPHVFNNVELTSREDLSRVWNEQKRKEGKVERIKYEKDYAIQVLEWMKETIHNKKSLEEILEETYENR